MGCRRGGPITVFSPRFLPSAILYHALLAAVRLVDVALFGLRVHGRENLRGITRAILVSNHTLVLDPGLIAHAVRPRRVYFTMLEETALIPALGTFVRLLGGVPLVRGSGARRERAIDEAVQQLGFVHFFPEGECHLRNQQIRSFRRGAFHAALRRGLPVIPVTTVLRERAWPLWRRLGLPPRVLVVIGRPRTAGAAAGARSAEEDLARTIHDEMQTFIDREGGCKTIARGQMPRIALHRAIAAA
jgi:1-acyl-sn-glycerol-3-phosphate acyltransferase